MKKDENIYVFEFIYIKIKYRKKFFLFFLFLFYPLLVYTGIKKLIKKKKLKNVYDKNAHYIKKKRFYKKGKKSFFFFSISRGNRNYYAIFHQ